MRPSPPPSPKKSRRPASRMRRALVVALCLAASSLLLVHMHRMDAIVQSILLSQDDGRQLAASTKMDVGCNCNCSGQQASGNVVKMRYSAERGSSVKPRQEERNHFYEQYGRGPMKLAPWDASQASGGHDLIARSCQAEIDKSACRGKLPLYNCLKRYNNDTAWVWLSPECKKVIVLPCPGGDDECQRRFDAFQPALNATEVRRVEDLLQKMHNSFAARGIQYWMAAGSAIGGLYHHSRIPWDDDIDMYVLKEDVDAATKELERRLGVRVPTERQIRDGHINYKVFDKSGPMIPGTHPQHSYPFVDLFPINCNETACVEKNKWHEEHGDGINNPKDWIFPLKWRPFGRLSLPFPNKLTDTIENRYGHDAKEFCIRHGYNHKKEKFRGRKHHHDVKCENLTLSPALVVSVTDGIFRGPAEDRHWIRPWEKDLPKVTVEHLMDNGTGLSSVTFYDGNEIRRSYADGLMDTTNGQITFHSAGTSSQPILVPFLREERESYVRNEAHRSPQVLNQEVMPMLDTPEVANDYVSEVTPRDSGRLRIGEWNAERGGNWHILPKFIPGANIIILNEMDWGMARSGNVHTIRSMAKSLRMNYAYGVEFMELTNGNAKEIKATQGESNAAGYHGNAVLSKWLITDATIVRLHPLYDKLYTEKSEGMDSGERRLGGRMALFATTHIGKDQILLISVHSHAGSPKNLVKDDAITICNEIKRRNATNVLIGGDTGPPLTTTLVSDCGFHPLEKTNKKNGRRFQPTWRVDCPDGGPPHAKFPAGTGFWQGALDFLWKRTRRNYTYSIRTES